MNRVPPLPAATLALALGACVPEGDFPSLAMRPAERQISTEAPVRPPVAVPSDAALLGRVDELRGLAQQGEQAFDAAFDPAAATVASAGAAGSESWVDAQQAVSGLEAAREPTARALAELDQLAIGRANLPTNAEDFAAISAAIAAVQGIAAGQRERLDRLKARLSSG